MGFDADGLRLAGHLHLPHADGPAPGLVLTGPLSGVEDQVTGHYAHRLAVAGFVTLAFDHRSFGESAGEPRQREDSAGKLADLRAATGWLRGRAEVRADALGILGICLGGDYAVKAAASDPRLRAVACVAAAYKTARRCSPHRWGSTPTARRCSACSRATGATCPR